MDQHGQGGKRTGTLCNAECLCMTGSVLRLLPTNLCSPIGCPQALITPATAFLRHPLPHWQLPTSLHVFLPTFLPPPAPWAQSSVPSWSAPAGRGAACCLPAIMLAHPHTPNASRPQGGPLPAICPLRCRLTPPPSIAPCLQGGALVFEGRRLLFAHYDVATSAHVDLDLLEAEASKSSP